ncbi:hypothetical protein Rhopal_002448-T1 [Rhodotorula paludigena]|uniref:Xylose isomerase-like TIM barrel domain-containing protein n=1 Tax=Rhodotorula paludigena TaxID=86838 RepID=A0AAV5GJ43_9BASI|nr:hypothetical protein Rhopal_002448-T1 [Rhodotorula paludigena]
MSLGLGAAGHKMPDKLRAAAEAGFKGTEVFYPCLEAFAEDSFSSDFPDRRDALRAAATETRRLTDQLGLDIFVLQPLLNYDGIIDEEERRQRCDDAVFRFEICGLLGCDLMQIPANFRLDAGVSGDEDKIVADMQELADLGAAHSPPIRFAYEAMCWSTTNYTWQHIGLVLDAFHIAGYEYADPCSTTGVRDNGAERLAASLEELVRTVSLSKIYYLQLADARLLSPPLLPLGSTTAAAQAEGKAVSPLQVDGQQPRMTWSRTSRLFPGESDRGGYMPIWECAQAFLKTGYKGYVSFELFNSDMNKPDPAVTKDHAQRGKKSWALFEREVAA